MAKPKNQYLADRREQDKHMMACGMELGAQQMVDYVALALRDPEITGGRPFTRERIKKLFGEVHRLMDQFHPAFVGGMEADYHQELLDRILKEIWGDELEPFNVRYQWIKQERYDKPHKGTRT